jgi:hypothetical protein
MIVQEFSGLRLWNHPVRWLRQQVFDALNATANIPGDLLVVITNGLKGWDAAVEDFQHYIRNRDQRRN